MRLKIAELQLEVREAHAQRDEERRKLAEVGGTRPQASPSPAAALPERVEPRDTRARRHEMQRDSR